MSDLTAILALVLFVALFAADAVLLESAGIVYLGKRVLEVTTWLAFWR